MEYNFDEIVDRRDTNCVKWDGRELLEKMGITDRFDEDTIPAFTADMDFKCPVPLIDAMVEVANRGIYGYTMLSSDSIYYDAIIQWFSKYGWEIKKEEILQVPSTLGALQNAISMFTNPKEGIIMHVPIYGPFKGIIESAGRTVITSQLINDGEGYYTIDFEEFEYLASQKENTGFLICNPHNPVGRIWTNDELERLVSICKKYNVFIFSDEVHCDIVRIGMQYNPLGRWFDYYNKIIVFTGINKTFNTAGIQISNAVVKDEKIREQFSKTRSMFLSPFIIEGLIAAYTKCDDWLVQVREYIDENINWAINFLKEKMPKVICKRPEATYCLWMDFRAYGLEEKELIRRIMKEANVVLEQGSMFDHKNGEGFMRICLPMRKALLVEAFERIAEQFFEEEE